MALRREYPDHVIFWNRADLLRKLGHFASYYNEARAHSALAGRTPSERRGHPSPAIVDLRQFSWQARCRGLFQTPIAA
jgi:hypothetical protein